MALTARLRDFTHIALDLIFPPQCAGCGAVGAEFCDRCAQAVEPVGKDICARCGRPRQTAATLCPDCQNRQHSLAFSRAAALHTAPLREAIHALKYQDRPQLAQPLGRYLVAVFRQEPWASIAPRIDAVVPAPLHADRLLERGYNQSELLAGVLCEATGLVLRPAWLERVRATRQQVGLNSDERKQNVAGAFCARPDVRGRTLLIVDDVYTTGATLEACASAACAHGASGVYGLTLAVPARL